MERVYRLEFSGTFYFQVACCIHYISNIFNNHGELAILSHNFSTSFSTIAIIDRSKFSRFHWILIVFDYEKTRITYVNVKNNINLLN